MKKPSVHKALETYLHARYRLEALRKLVLFLFFSALLWLFALLLEYALWMPPALRRIVFYSVWGIQLVLLGIFVIYPGLQWAGFFRRRPLTDVAREIGEALPQVSDKLLNYLQLEQLTDIDRQMLAYELQRREKELLGFDFRRILPARRYVRYVYLLFIPLTIGAIFRIESKPGALKASYRRLAAYDRTFTPPAPFRVRIVSPPYAVPDSSYTLKVGVSGDVLPRQMEWVGPQGRIPLRPEGDTLFTHHFEWLERPLRFYLQSGRYRFGPFRIDLLRLPAVDSFRVQLVYPAYLHRRPAAETIARTDWQVPEGTRAGVHLYFHHADSLKGLNGHFSLNGDSLKQWFFLTRDTLLRLTLLNSANSRQAEVAFNVRVTPDWAPEIKAAVRRDTGLYRIRHYHWIQAADDHGLQSLWLVYRPEGKKWQRKRLKKWHHTTDFAGGYVFPDDFSLPDTIAYTYYFQVYDNNTATGPRHAESQWFGYQPLLHRADDRQRREQEAFRQAQAHLQRFGRTNRQMDRQLRRMQIDQGENWQLKTQVSEQLARSRREKEALRRLNRQLEAMMKKFKQADPRNPELKELEKRLNENRQRLQNDSLERSIQRMLDKLQKEQLLQQLEKLKNQNRLEQRSMERMLELLKRFYVEQSLRQMADSLGRLGRQQEKMARQNVPDSSAQKQLNERTHRMQQHFDTLQQLNRQLKSPLKIPPLQSDFKAARMFQKQALRQMPQAPAKARDMQKRAAEKLNEMASALQSGMQSASMQQKKEDLEMIKKLIKSLIDVSFEQEKLWARNPADRMAYSDILIDQHRLVTTVAQAADSLNAIALRQPAISEDLFDYVSKALYHGRRALQLMQDARFGFVEMQQKEFYQNVNRLIYLLNLFLESQSKNGMGVGAGQKQSDQQLPDKIRQKAGKIKQMMQEGLRHKQGRKGREGMSQRAWQLYKEQQQLKEMLQKFRDDYPSKRIAELNRQLDELSKKILRKGLTRKNVDEYLQWQYELLKLLHAAYKQHEDEKRRSRTGHQRQQPADSLRLEMFRRYFPQYEQLIRTGIPLAPYYEQIYKKYKNQL